MIRIQQALTRLVEDLQALNLDWAVIGGLAVSARAEPRSTRDVDIALVAESDSEAEQVVSKFQARGYLIDSAIEHKTTGRMATVRLRPPGGSLQGVLVDLFFASSGIEREIIEKAEPLELWPGMSAPVATTGCLLALKALAARPKDLEDMDWLLRFAESKDLNEAREAIALIQERGFDRNKNLSATLKNALQEQDA